jgi:serine/threonine-protein kinase HipA
MMLDVYLYGQPVGTLRAGKGLDFSFQYSAAVARDAGPGAVVLSESLHVQPEPFGPMATRNYFEGLLPEGARRDEIARRLRVSPNDAFRLLSALGRDCAGAVSIVPEEAAATAAPFQIQWLEPTQLEELVDELPKRPLGIDAGKGKLRLSLAGVQRKLALVREDDRFGLPGDDDPSTVLVKPQFDDEYPDLVANEMFCLSIARAIGIPAARTEMTAIGGRPCLISHRFDRTETDRGRERVHQEDLCQALGIPSNLKYQSDSGPGFPEFRRLLERIGRGADVRTMVRAAALNYTLGNSDAHGKNFAILFAPGGRRLAPLYDIVSTAVYDLQDDMAMSVGDAFAPEAAGLADWLDMSYDCDLPPDRFFALVRETSIEVRVAAEAQLARARSDGWHAPILDEIEAVAIRRSERVAGAIDSR